MRDKFTEIYRRFIKRPGSAELFDCLESSDFFTAPASTRFHESYPGGLVEHSVLVYRELLRLMSAYPEITVSDESAAIVALLHDVAKIGCYKVELRNKKDEFGKWIQVPFYTFKEDFAFGGHGSKSVYLIQEFMTLTAEEAVAINCHMGPENGNTAVYDAYRQFPLAYMLHAADTAATIPKIGANCDE